MRQFVKEDGQINFFILLIDMQANTSTNVVPVFSAMTSFYKADTINQFIPFSSFDIDTKTEHGDFDLHRGTPMGFISYISADMSS